MPEQAREIHENGEPAEDTDDDADADDDYEDTEDNDEKSTDSGETERTGTPAISTHPHRQTPSVTKKFSSPSRTNPPAKCGFDASRA